MSVVVTLQRYVPIPRTGTGAVPWTTARILESAAETGPFVQIDQITLSPVDTDPANPVPRDLTTANATLTDGWYEVVWVDANGAVSDPTAPLENAPATGTRPSVQEVASRLRARTKIAGGKELGTWTTTTRPTAGEVEDLIDDALDEVLGKVQPIDDTQQFGSAYNAPGSDYERRIRRAVALYAAILVELSYFPEQIRSGQSPVTTMQQLYDSRIRALISEGETGRAEGMGVGGSGGGGGDAPADAAWAYPADGGGMVGWGSRWLYDPALFDPERRRCS